MLRTRFIIKINIDFTRVFLYTNINMFNLLGVNLYVFNYNLIILNTFHIKIQSRCPHMFISFARIKHNLLNKLLCENIYKMYKL
jgi:hypothetical protein